MNSCPPRWPTSERRYILATLNHTGWNKSAHLQHPGHRAIDLDRQDSPLFAGSRGRPRRVILGTVPIRAHRFAGSRRKWDCPFCGAGALCLLMGLAPFDPTHLPAIRRRDRDCDLYWNRINVPQLRHSDSRMPPMANASATAPASFLDGSLFLNTRRQCVDGCLTMCDMAGPLRRRFQRPPRHEPGP